MTFSAPYEHSNANAQIMVDFGQALNHLAQQEDTHDNMPTTIRDTGPKVMVVLRTATSAGRNRIEIRSTYTCQVFGHINGIIAESK